MTGDTSNGKPGSGRAVGVAALMFVAIAFIMIALLKFSMDIALIAALLCAVYTFVMLCMARRALNVDLENDYIFRAQVRRAHRLPYAGMVLCIIFALPFGAVVAADHVSQSDLDEFATMSHIRQQIAQYDKQHGAGAYEKTRRQYGMSEEQFEDTLFATSADRHAMVRAVVNPLMLGGETFLGTLACSLLLVGGLEVPAMNLGLSPIMSSIRKRNEQSAGPAGGVDTTEVADVAGTEVAAGADAAGADGNAKANTNTKKRRKRKNRNHYNSGLDFSALPADTHEMVRKSMGTPALYVTDDMMLETSGSPRVDAMAVMMQGMALWHVRKGLMMLCAFGVWAALAMVGVMFDVVS